MRIAIVVPHIFMQRDILPHVIFSPGQLALQLADGLVRKGIDVTIFTPGPVETTATNMTADLSYFEAELQIRGDSYIDLLKKHPLTFITLARQVQSEIIARSFAMANDDYFDLVHIYTNEEDTALPFSSLCSKPVVFTHHDPYNFLIKYKAIFPKYADRNWISFSLAQRLTMPPETHWIANIYHGLDKDLYTPSLQPTRDYVAYIGRIVEPKGVHVAIQAVQHYNRTHSDPIMLKIAGKHYADHVKDTYWRELIEPHLDDEYIEYIGYIKDNEAKEAFIGNARCLLVPSLFSEPFGMVMIEALACDTPCIGLDSGAIPEVIKDGRTGYIVQKVYDATNNAVDIDATSQAIADRIDMIDALPAGNCRQDFEERFVAKRMCHDYLEVYKSLVT